MDEKLKDWKGTKSEVDYIVNITIEALKERNSIGEKKARKLFCECIIRNLVINEFHSIAEYLLTGEIN